MTSSPTHAELERFTRRILVTGGAGFIGANLLQYLVPRYPDWLFVNFDALTYAGNLLSVQSIESAVNYRMVHANICDAETVNRWADEFQIDAVLHLAAESHVDRSIEGPGAFIATNILGTFTLLQMARKRSENRPFRFHHVSTDEVFGSLGDTGYFSEATPYAPNSPYSASKASADHLVRAYAHTYGLDVVITNCSNNYGPYQFPEKLIPLIIRNAVAGLPLPVYGDGRHIRDWLFVEDHCRALEAVFLQGKPGATYVVGGENEVENIELVRTICRELDSRLGGEPRERLISFVKDRPGHDRRYAVDPARIKRELDWRPQVDYRSGLALTIDWYLANTTWLDACLSGEYRAYYERTYANR